MKRTLYTPDHEDFRAVVREFVDREVTPNVARWDSEHSTGRQVWRAAGAQGIIGLTCPEELGGNGIGDYRYRMVVCEELARVAATSLSSSFGLQDDILMPYVVKLGTPQQQERLLPAMAAGEYIMAIAMTEPGTGSDLRGIRTTGARTDGGWIVNGAKTFITSGIQADGVIVVARTSAEGGSDGFTLLLVENGAEGFSRGRQLDKLGQSGQDNAELFFDNVFVPDDAVIGQVGGGFRHLMLNLPTERLGIAMGAVAAIDAAIAWTVDYTRQRQAFGQRIADFQNTRFVLAECESEADVLRTYVDACLLAINAGELSAVDAAKAKWITTEAQHRILSRCLQLFGGYGYMKEYPIARAYADCRVQMIYGGTNEIMKEIIGRDLLGRG